MTCNNRNEPNWFFFCHSFATLYQENLVHVNAVFVFLHKNENCDTSASSPSSLPMASVACHRISKIDNVLFCIGINETIQKANLLGSFLWFSFHSFVFIHVSSFFLQSLALSFCVSFSFFVVFDFVSLELAVFLCAVAEYELELNRLYVHKWELVWCWDYMQTRDKLIRRPNVYVCACMCG